MPGPVPFLGSLTLYWWLLPQMGANALRARILLFVGPALQILDHSRVDPRYADFIERCVRHRSKRWRNEHASRKQRGCENPLAIVPCQFSDARLAYNSCHSSHGRFPGDLIQSLFRISCLQSLAASRVARNALPGEENLWPKGSSAAVLALRALGLSSVNIAPRATTGVLANGDLGRRCRLKSSFAKTMDSGRDSA